MSQIIADAVKKYMEAVETRLSAFREENRVALEENRALREEVRSLHAEVIQTRAVAPDVSEQIRAAVDERVASIPIPQPRDGIDGTSVDPAEVERMVADHVTRAVAAIPAPKDGKDADMIVVTQTIHDEMERQKALWQPLIDEALTRGLAALPVPKDGRDADTSALPELVGTEVERATAGLPSMVNEVVSRAIAALPRPADGIDGRDGIATREELESLIEDRFADIRTRTIADWHRGVWKSGELYRKGEIAVLDGSTWLAMVDSKAAPGTGPEWRLLAKQGRPGRDKK